jgi:Metalloenzyme superfamily
MRLYLRCLVVLTSFLVTCLPADAQNNTQNVILITLDGARNEEIFGGLDLEILKSITKEGFVEETPLYKKYWAPTPGERREKLMPFFWSTLMKDNGSIAGNRKLGSTVEITNGHRFSYPGYSEILTGQARDEVINSNDKRRQPNSTVLEFLKRKLQLNTRQVAAFASWDTMDWIVEHEPGSITSNAGYEAYEHPDPVIQELSRFQFQAVTAWDGARHDAYTFRFAMAHLKSYHPRVLYISFDETDDWAHDGRYDRVLQALERTDAQLRELWQFLQGDQQYRGKTTVIITVDHGRGNIAGQWRDHGKRIDGAKHIWIAIVSPDNQLRGEWKNTDTIYQNQIAATMCRLLNVDYSENNPGAGKPIARLFR